MKKYVFFDDLFHGKHFERKFYYFCLFRQFKLIKYLPLFILYNILYFFRIKKREAYLSVRWGFLKDVDELALKRKSFFGKRKNSLALNVSEYCVLSEHPRMMLEDIFPELIANVYDIEKKSFPCFKRARDFITEEKYEAYGKLFSSIMRDAAIRHFVYGKREYKSAAAYIGRTALHYTVSYALMIVYSFAIGLCSLYFACRNHLNHADLFFSYLERPVVLLLNIFPILFLCAFFYLITNSTAVSCLLSSGLAMLLTWINYYKLFFRNDPFLFGDIAIAMEAKMMTESYKVVLTPLIICMIIGIVAFAVIMAIYFRAPIKNFFVRAILTMLSLIVGYNAFISVYLDKEVYTSALDGRFIKQWSATDQFLSRGFLYPFIYSYLSAFDNEPEGYSEDKAIQQLSNYTYTDIPEDKRVNIISIMLESWGDLSKFDSVEFTNSGNPYEMLNELYNKSYHGELVNDIFSAGTVTTERQFLTGFTTLSNFRKATNTYAWYFRDQGYTVEGGHPCHDWFYNRQNINKNLGFENYYFDQNRYLELSGRYNCLDETMFPDIMTLFDEAMDRGENYFSFNVTYEGHGPYAYDVQYEKEYIVRNGLDDATFNNVNNYLAKMESVNKAIVELSEEVMAREEPLVLILFGDHMPGLGTNNSGYASLGINIDLSTPEGFLNYYSTPYLILANDAAKEMLGNDFVGEGPLIGPYFLMTEFFRLAGYTGDEYMQFAAEMYEKFQVYHITGVLAKDGEVIMTGISDYADIESDFDIVQYYRRNEFVYG